MDVGTPSSLADRCGSRQTILQTWTYHQQGTHSVVMDRVVKILTFVVIALGRCPAQGEEAVQLQTTSVCTPQTLTVPNRLHRVTVTVAKVASTQAVYNSSTKLCSMVITFDGIPTGRGLEIYLVNFHNTSLPQVNISVSRPLQSGETEKKTVLLNTDKVETKSPICLMSRDGLVGLHVTYHVIQSANVTRDLFHLKGVTDCGVNSGISATHLPPVVMAGDVQDEGEGPNIGTSLMDNVNKPTTKPPLDIIIITAVGVAAVIGMIVAGFAVKRWIRNSVVEERRLSQIRVNSHGSHTRSTSPSRHSSQTRPSIDQSEAGGGPIQYGSIRIGGRLPSSEDDSDLFADTKSTKTDVVML